MAPRQVLFTVRNLTGKRPQKLTAPPAKISAHRLRAGEWRVAKSAKKPAASSGKGKGKGKRKAISKKQASSKVPKTALDVLKCEDPEWACSNCDRTADDSECGISCYREFKKSHLKEAVIQIRGPGPMGYSAHVAPSSPAIPKGTILGEYIGELRPLSVPATATSLYRIEIPNVCAIDAEEAGNWTRFVNSSCRPNVTMVADFVAKRHVVVLEAVRRIQPGEEVTFQYGKAYFERAGFGCRCEFAEGEHLPGGKTKGRRRVRGEEE